MILSDELIRALPKTDLHVHLDGSLRLETLIELARVRRVPLPSETPEGLCELVFKPSYANLDEYLTGFAYTAAVLQHPDAIERTAYELAIDNIEEGVRYLEVRFAPHLHVSNRLTMEEVLVAVWKGLDRAEREHRSSEAVIVQGEPPFRAGIIVCALRSFEPNYSWYYDHLCQVLTGMDNRSRARIASQQLAKEAVRIRDTRGVPIVGFDLAGQEHGFPAIDHQEAYQYAHEHFLNRTVHAGEAYGPESIFQAITGLHADRIGHGYHLFSPSLITNPAVKDRERFVHELAQYIADRRITIEVCITSNLQTNPSIGSVTNHKFREMLDARLSTTLCTDNRLVSHTTVSKELRLAIDTFHISADGLRDLVVYGFKRSFFPGEYREKRRYVRGVLDHYTRVLERFRSADPAPP
jgi:adenosine deaminase